MNADSPLGSRGAAPAIPHPATCNPQRAATGSGSRVGVQPCGFSRALTTIRCIGWACAWSLAAAGTAFGGAIDDLERASGGRVDRPGNSGSQEADEARRERAQAWAEYRAEQRAEREAKLRAEAFALNEKGNKAFTARDWKTAIDCYKKARSLSPADPMIRQNLRNAEDALVRATEFAAALAKKKAAAEAEQRELARKRAEAAKLERERKQRYEKDLAAALARLKGDQTELENEPAVWIEKNGKLVQRRLKEPNKWSAALAASLTTKAPPLPYKKFEELQPGDVLLIAPERMDPAGRTINAGDALLSGTRVSDASHTVLYLKQVNGVKFFLDNIPGEGPRVVPEAYLLKKYGRRQTEVARLAQPLKEEEGRLLYAAAREMRARNLERMRGNKWFSGTTYGAWGEDDVVCAEADWALLKAAGRKIPASKDRLKKGLGVDFSPADFYSTPQFFLVTPLALPPSPDRPRSSR